MRFSKSRLRMSFHPGELQDDAPFRCNGAATEAGPGAARQKGHSVPLCHSHDLDDIPGAGREDYKIG